MSYSERGSGTPMPTPMLGNGWFEESGWMRGKEPARMVKYGDRGNERWENDTVSPADSISQVSSSRPSRVESRRSGTGSGIGSGSGRQYYPLPAPSRYSGSGSGRVSMANGRLVKIEAPEWA